MKKWSEFSALEKVTTIISFVAVFAWIIFEILGRKGLAFADLGSQISITVICASEAISFWKQNRVISYIALGGVVCLIATIVLTLCI